MVMVNGSQGIGWSTNIPNHCPRELAKNVLRMIDGQEPDSVVPHNREIIESKHTKCHSFGEVAVLDDDTLEVSELPVGVWTESFTERVYKSAHKSALHNSEIEDIRIYRALIISFIQA